MLRRLINLAGSMVVWTADWLGEHVSRLFARPQPSKCMVLAYHSVPAEQRSLFIRQMDLLLRQAKVVHADVEGLPEPGKRYAVITFDDGYEDVVDNALPELEKRGVPSTIFVVTELLGCDRSWEHRGGESTSRAKLMSRDQLISLQPELVRIGSHTMTHAFLPHLDDGKLHEEISGSRAKLERLLNREVSLFAFPYGAFDEKVIAGCREAGYTRVFTALPVFAFSERGEFITGRVGAAPTDWQIEFRLKLAGAYRWLPQAYELKRQIREALRARKVKSVQVDATQKRVA